MNKPQVERNITDTVALQSNTKKKGKKKSKKKKQSNRVQEPDSAAQKTEAVPSVTTGTASLFELADKLGSGKLLGTTERADLSAVERDPSDRASKVSARSDQTITQPVPTTNFGQRTDQFIAFEGWKSSHRRWISPDSDDRQKKYNSGNTEDNALAKARDVEAIRLIDQSTAQKFKFDSMDPCLRCPKPDCRKMTSCWDHVVVICPACGPESSIRYCNKQHLYEDIQRHWLYECGTRKILGSIDFDTIRHRQSPKRPYVANQCHNLLERHRQAVYRAMEDADFFIFNDVDMVDTKIVPPTISPWNLARGTGSVVLQIIFPEDKAVRSRRDLFNQHITMCLMFGNSVASPSCMTALHLVREALILSGNWTEGILTYLCMQLAGEWGNFNVPESFCNVDEVNALWRTQRQLPSLPGL